MATVGQSIERLIVKNGDSYQGLRVFPVCSLSGEFEKPSGLRTLEDGISSGAVETNETGDMSIVRIRNKSADSVAALDGETLIGGGQNRMINAGRVLSPGEEAEVSTCCVEIHRWDCRPGKTGLHDDKKQFSKTASAFGGLKRRRLVESLENMKSNRRFEPDQRKVWVCIAEAFGVSGAATKTLDLHDLYDYWETHLKLFSSRFTIRPGQVGMIVFLDRQTWFADIFPDNDMLHANFRKLLKGYSLDALLRLERNIEPPSPSAIKIEDARAILKLLKPALLHPLDQTKHKGSHFFETAKFCGTALTTTNGFAHIFACSKQ